MAILDLTHLAEDCKNRRLDAVNGIVLHRSHVADTAFDTAIWFRDNPQYTGGKPPYHIMIEKSGRIVQLVPFSKIAPGARIANKTKIQLAFCGDFREHTPTIQQFVVGQSVVRELSWWIGQVNVFRHDEIPGSSGDPSKVCPGERLNVEAFRDLASVDFEAWPLDGRNAEARSRGWTV